MKKFFKIIGYLFLGFIALGVIGMIVNPEGSEEEIDVEELMETYEATIVGLDAEFVEAHLGETPEEVVAARYADFEEQYGDAMMDYIDSNGDETQVMARYLSEKLDVEYAQMAYIQVMSGTNGLKVILSAMDPSAPGVSEAVEAFARYDQVTDYDPEYFKSIIDEDLTPQEEAEAILEVFAEVHALFWTDADLKYYSSKETLYENAVELSGLNADNLRAVIGNSHFNVSRIFELFPDELEYKEALLELV